MRLISDAKRKIYYFRFLFQRYKLKPKLYNQLIFCFYHPFLHWRSGWSVNSTLSISEEIEVELKFYYFDMIPYWEIDFRSRPNLRNFSSVFKYWILFLRRIFSCVYALENVAAELSHPIFLFEYLKRAINKMLNYWFSSKQTNLQFKVSICKFCQTRSFWRAFFCTFRLFVIGRLFSNGRANYQKYYLII